MKKLIYLFVSVLILLSVTEIMAQTMTELVVPQYFGSKSGASANTNRTPIAICLKFDGLTPSTAYDVKFQIGLLTDAITSYGAGNIWDGTAYSGSKVTNAFTTDAAGSSVPVWFYFQPTGNGTRFDAGMQHNVRVGVITTGGTMPGSPSFLGTKILTALDIASVERTAATTDDGCFIKGTAVVATSGKYVLLFDNIEGTGDPLFSYQIRTATATNANQSDLPTEINEVYLQAVPSVIGDYPAVIPIGANNPNGVRRIEARNADNTLFGFSPSASGVWGATNTTTLTRRAVGVIDSVSAPVPVELVSLAATSYNNSVSLTWKTATETNNQGFEIERKSNNQLWEKVGFVSGNGSSTEIRSYSFIDGNLSGLGVFSYRLKQIDNDGSFEYSSVINVTVGTPANFELNQNYPNPFNPSTTINFTLPEASQIKLVVYNMLGQSVATLFDGAKEAGYHSVVFNAAGLTSGIYFYQIQSDNFNSVKKMILAK
ncbi:MAG: T9SS type A sorting domain-containing protein [bacterium]